MSRKHLLQRSGLWMMAAVLLLSSLYNVMFLNGFTSAVEVQTLGHEEIKLDCQHGNITQGGTTDGTYIYLACMGGSSIYLTKYEVTGEFVKDKNHGTTLGHANDIAYNSARNQLVISDWNNVGPGNRNIYFINPDSLEIEEKKDVGRGFSTLCYKPSADQYLSGGTLYDNDFEKVAGSSRIYEIDKVIPGDYDVNQGIYCDDQYIYLLRGYVNRNAKPPTIAVLNWSGEIQNLYTVDIKFEPESIFVINGELYITFIPPGKELVAKLTGATTASGNGGPNSKDMKRIFNAGISQYNSGGCVSGSVGRGVYGKTAIEKTWNGLISVGFTPEQTAGILGNMTNESGLSPTRHEISFMGTKTDFDTNAEYSYGIGLIQWSFGRRVKVIEKLKEANLYDPYISDYNTYSMPGQELIEANLIDDSKLNDLYEVELAYLWEEINSVDSYKGILDTTTVEEATKFFLEHVEIPRNPYLSSHPERLVNANGFYDMYENGDLGGNSNGSSSGISSSSSGTVSGKVWLDEVMPDVITKEEPDPSALRETPQDKWTTADNKPNKIILHYTVGTTNGLAAYGSNMYPAHFTYDAVTNKGYQHFPLDKPSLAVKGKENDGSAIQIEVVGVYGGDYDGNGYNWRQAEEFGGSAWDGYRQAEWGDTEWDNLAKLLVAISQATGIPLTSTADWTSTDPIENFGEYTGIAAHYHAPGNSTKIDIGPVWDQVQAAIGRVGGAPDECGEGAKQIQGDVLAAVDTFIAAAQRYGSVYSCNASTGNCAPRKGEYVDEFLNGKHEYDTDCTGFVAAVLYMAFGKYSYSTSSGLLNGDNKYLKEIDKADVQPGDIGAGSGGSGGHGWIITKVDNGKITEVAETASASCPDKKGKNNNICRRSGGWHGSWYSTIKYFRWIGGGDE